MLSGASVFAEGISIVPFAHTRPKQGLRVLILGCEAAPAGALYLRYPDTAQVLYYKTNAPNNGKARQIPGIAVVDSGWKADVAVIALPGSPLNEIAQIKPLLADDALVCVAVEDTKTAPSIKNGLKSLFPFVVPYRVHMPEPAIFFLTSRAEIGRQRPVPASAQHLSDQYLPCLFTFAKDEYRFIMQGI